MAHAQKTDFVFRRNGRVHLNRQGRQFSGLLAAEVCASAVVMLDTPRSEVAWEYWLPTAFTSFPFTSPSVCHQLPNEQYHRRPVKPATPCRNAKCCYRTNNLSFPLRSAFRPPRLVQSDKLGKSSFPCKLSAWKWVLCPTPLLHTPCPNPLIPLLPTLPLLPLTSSPPIPLLIAQ
jgi:hypothetical protein